MVVVVVVDVDGFDHLHVHVQVDVHVHVAAVIICPVRALPSGWSVYYRVVRRIPRGRVATYGEVALVAGKPGAARQVGFALAALRGSVHDVPWQRVLGARPRGHAAISLLDPVGAAVQRTLLEAEGVAFDERDRIDLARFGWKSAPLGERRGSRMRLPRSERGARGGARAEGPSVPPLKRPRRG